MADADQPVRALPLRYEEPAPPVLRDEVRTAAIAAAGGVLAGAATVAAVRVVGAVGSRKPFPEAPAPSARAPRQRRRQPLLPGRRPPAGALAADGRSSGRSRSRFGLPRRTGLPASGGEDRVMRVSGGVAARLLHVEGSPVLLRAWQPGADRVAIRAEPVDPDAIAAPSAPPPAPRPGRPAAAGGRGGADALRARGRRGPRRVPPPFPPRPAARAAAAPQPPLPPPPPAVALGGARLGRRQAADRCRAGDPDPAPHRRPLGGQAGRGPRGPARRPRRRGDRRSGPGRAGVDGPGAAPGDRAARRRPRGRRRALRPRRGPAGDRRLLAVPEIGPWTVQCLGLFGRGDPDSLPAGDLGYVKLVGRLAGLGRRATVEEVEEFYAPFAPFRGLAGALTLAGLHRAVAQGPPLRPPERSCVEIRAPTCLARCTGSCLDEGAVKGLVDLSISAANGRADGR